MERHRVGGFGDWSRRAVLALVLTPVLALGSMGAVACGPASSAAEWAKVSAETCRSTIARAHLKDPSEAQLSPERFLEERRKLLDGHRGFNTVTAFRTVCSRIRQELLTPKPPTPEGAGP